MLLVLLALLSAAPAATAAPPAPDADLRTRVAIAVAASPRTLHAAKAAVALAAAALLAWGAWLSRRGRAEAYGRPRGAALAVLAVLGLAAGWNFGLVHGDHYVHWWDVYHYYFGAKFAPELGYTRLYACTSVADAQLGHAGDVLRRPLRDLATNRLGSNAEILRDPSACTARFTPARWNAFVRDVAWFRSKVPAARWNVIALDHGFNATPVWTAAGRLLANTGPASEAQVLALVLADSVLVLAALALVWWAFGWRAAAVSTIVFGTNTAADFSWIGGSFLRLDWLFLAVAGVCLLRKGKPLAAGFALGWSALLRIFPVLLGAVPGVKAVAQPARARWRFVGGGLLAAAVLVPLSLPGEAPDGGWPGFVANSRKHLGTPSANNMGLKTLLSTAPPAPMHVGPGEDPAAVWWRPHAAALEKRMPLFWLLLALYAVLLVRASLRQPDWVAAVVSLGLVPFATVVSCYYYVLLLVLGTLTALGEGWGAAACALAAATGLCAVAGGWDYEIYVLTSAAVLVFFAAAAARLGAPVARESA